MSRSRLVGSGCSLDVSTELASRGTIPRRVSRVNTLVDAADSLPEVNRHRIRDRSPLARKWVWQAEAGASSRRDWKSLASRSSQTAIPSPAIRSLLNVGERSMLIYRFTRASPLSSLSSFDFYESKPSFAGRSRRVAREVERRRRGAFEGLAHRFRNSRGISESRGNN